MKTAQAKKLKGFTLVELIVVIAIIGTLAGILVPSTLGFVKKAQKKADLANAKRLYDDVITILMTDELEYVSDLSTVAAETPWNSFCRDHKTKWNKSTLKVTTKDGETETYPNEELVIVCKIIGNTGNNGYSRADSNGIQNWYGNSEDSALRRALNMKVRYHSGKFPIPMQSKNVDGKPVTSWLLCYRKSKHNTDDEAIEIWAGYSKGDWECGPTYRLYPNPSVEYLE